MGFPVSGPTLLVAEEASRFAFYRPEARILCFIHTESRSSGQLRYERACAQTNQSVAAAHGDRIDVRRSGNADALPGPGVRCGVPISLLCGPQTRSRAAR